MCALCIFILVFETIKAAQAQHGLRHEDYLRYRQYCSRRLHRVRKLLKFSHGRKVFKKRNLQAKNVSDYRYLTIPLLCAERAWAYAMQLKQELSEDEPRKRFHLLRRLKKAADHAKHVRSLCQDCTTTRSQLEAEAYCAWMEGNVAFEQEEWVVCGKKYAQAKTVLSELSKVGDEDFRALCQERVTSITHLIGYCRYFLSREQGDSKNSGLAEIEALADAGVDDEMLQSKLSSVVAEAAKREAAEMSSISWNGQDIIVKTKRVREALLEASFHLKSIEKTDSANMKRSQEFEHKMSLYTKVFSSYDDADSLVSKEIHDLEKSEKATTKTKSRDALIMLRDYVSFQKSQSTIDRNLVLADSISFNLHLQLRGARIVGKKNKPEDLVNLYQKLINNITSMKSLLEEKTQADVIQVLDNRAACFTAHRVFWLGETHLRNHNWAAAYVLYQRASDYVDTARKLDQNEIDRKALDKLEPRCIGQQSLAHAKAIIETEDAKDPAIARQAAAAKKRRAADIPLLEKRLGEYEAGSAKRGYQLSRLPPSLIATSNKPILFDLAFNHIEFPSIESRFSKQSSKKGGGWFGLW
jgi:signal recognition particle subunit SRP68